MTEFNPLREIKNPAEYTSKDVLAIFGEVFDLGYVNGLIAAAQSRGMKVVYATVGRRGANNELRPLTKEELAAKNQHPLINVPLESGFDLEPGGTGPSPVDQLKSLKMSQWKEAQLDWDLVEKSRQAGEKRFQSHVTTYLAELENHLEEGSNLVFAHTMAGGFPRAKVIMPVANRVFKGMGPRYSSSKEFWESTLGRLCDISFNEVTAESLRHLVELSEPLRNKIESRGQKVSYLAYGYHGTEVLINNEYQWQSYSPYLQGWAKLRLEEIASTYWQQGAKTMVFNAPEILTSSSSIFLGVEIVLYPLIAALKKEGPHSPRYKALAAQCENLLKDDYDLNHVLELTQNYMNNELIKNWPQFQTWPQHNGPEQMELMRTSSQDLIGMHKDTKSLMTLSLSEVVFKACGETMLSQAYSPEAPVSWIGHDLVAKLSLAD